MIVSLKSSKCIESLTEKSEKKQKPTSIRFYEIKPKDLLDETQDILSRRFYMRFSPSDDVSSLWTRDSERFLKPPKAAFSADSLRPFIKDGCTHKGIQKNFLSSIDNSSCHLPLEGRALTQEDIGKQFIRRHPYRTRFGVLDWSFVPIHKKDAFTLLSLKQTTFTLNNKYNFNFEVEIEWNDSNWTPAKVFQEFYKDKPLPPRESRRDVLDFFDEEMDLHSFSPFAYTGLSTGRNADCCAFKRIPFKPLSEMIADLDKLVDKPNSYQDEAWYSHWKEALKKKPTRQMIEERLQNWKELSQTILKNDILEAEAATASDQTKQPNWNSSDPRVMLGIPKTCSDISEITKQYRRLAKEYHPDRYQDNGEKFRKIETAYKALKKELLAEGFQFEKGEAGFLEANTAFKELLEKGKKARTCQDFKNIEKLWSSFHAEVSTLNLENLDSFFQDRLKDILDEAEENRLLWELRQALSLEMHPKEDLPNSEQRAHYEKQLQIVKVMYKERDLSNKKGKWKGLEPFKLARLVYLDKVLSLARPYAEHCILEEKKELAIKIRSKALRRHSKYQEIRIKPSRCERSRERFTSFSMPENLWKEAEAAWEKTTEECKKKTEKDSDETCNEECKEINEFNKLLDNVESNISFFKNIKRPPFATGNDFIKI